MSHENLARWCVAAALLLAAASASAARASLVNGLDGGEYPPYKASLVRETQQKLEQNGLYKGKKNGVLDSQTMRATAAFQKEKGLHVSGVPTPRTREQLGIE
jgi:peptidoglycan hydrolase-like protein with peptidoglycan-binding domain